jgi:hypothetical protein
MYAVLKIAKKREVGNEFFRRRLLERPSKLTALTF